jgi:hypothetical protein
MRLWRSASLWLPFSASVSHAALGNNRQDERQSLVLLEHCLTQLDTIINSRAKARRRCRGANDDDENARKLWRCRKRMFPRHLSIVHRGRRRELRMGMPKATRVLPVDITYLSPVPSSLCL